QSYLAVLLRLPFFNLLAFWDSGALRSAQIRITDTRRSSSRRGMRILLPTITRAQEQTGVHQGVIEAGAIIGHYEVRNLLGAGGMGEVYRARDTRLKRPVTLKLLSRNFAQHEDRLPRFRQEAFAASALNHPNIITIYEIGDCEFGPFIATELVEGETLRRRLKRAPIEISEALDLTLRVE